MRSCIEQDESIVSLQVLYIAEFVPGVQAVGESVQHEESRPGTFGLIVETHTSIGHVRHERRPPPDFCARITVPRWEHMASAVAKQDSVPEFSTVSCTPLGAVQDSARG